MADVYTDTKGFIRQRLADNAEGLAIHYENLSTDHLKDSNGVMPSEFAMLEVMIGDGDQVGLGKINDRKHRFAGVIMIHIFTALGVGDGRAMQIADDLADVFRSTSFNGITTRVPRIDAGSRANDKANYWRVTMTCPFFVDYNL